MQRASASPEATPAAASMGIASPKLVNLTVYVPPSLRRAAKIRAAQTGTTISKLVGALLATHLDESG